MYCTRRRRSHKLTTSPDFCSALARHTIALHQSPLASFIHLWLDYYHIAFEKMWLGARHHFPHFQCVGLRALRAYRFDRILRGSALRSVKLVNHHPGTRYCPPSKPNVGHSRHRPLILRPQFPINFQQCLGSLRKSNKEEPSCAPTRHPAPVLQLA